MIEDKWGGWFSITNLIPVTLRTVVAFPDKNNKDSRVIWQDFSPPEVGLQLEVETENSIVILKRDLFQKQILIESN